MTDTKLIDWSSMGKPRLDLNRNNFILRKMKLKRLWLVLLLLSSKTKTIKNDFLYLPGYLISKFTKLEKPNIWSWLCDANFKMY